MSITKRNNAKGPAYDVRLWNPEGTRQYRRSFRTRKGAEAYERDELARRARGTWVDPNGAKTTFAALADEWLKSNPAKRTNSLERDRSALSVHLLPAFGSRRIGTLTPANIQAFVNDMSEVRSARHVRRTYDVLRAVLNHAVDRDLLARTPCRRIRLPAVEPAAAHVFSPDDLICLADALGPDHGPMVWLGALLGLRWSEVAGLHVGSIDFLRGTVAITAQRTRGPLGTPVLAAPKSNAGRRTLAAPPPLLELLAEQLAARGLTGAVQDAMIFVSPHGEPLRYDNWRRRSWVPAAVQAGLGRIEVVHRADKPPLRRYIGAGFHDLRRTNSTALVSSGVDIKTVQTRMGHSDPRLTLAIYAQATTEADRAAADQLGEQLMASRTPTESGTDTGVVG